jgi:hypothetical protein
MIDSANEKSLPFQQRQAFFLKLEVGLHQHLPQHTMDMVLMMPVLLQSEHRKTQ